MTKLFFTLFLTVVATAAVPVFAASPAQPAASPFACPVKHPVSEASITSAPELIEPEMMKRFEAVMDANKSGQAKTSPWPTTATVDPALMKSLAEVSGCAALIDKEDSCSIYFSTHVGSPLSVFMDLKKSHPLRRQFEAAIGALPGRYEREAAQECIKRTGGK